MLQILHSCIFDWHILLPHYDGLTARTQMAPSLSVITHVHMGPTQDVLTSCDAFSSRRAQGGSWDCTHSAMLLCCCMINSAGMSLLLCGPTCHALLVQSSKASCRPDDMVVAAIISLQDPVGSHPDDIMHWIQVSHARHSHHIASACLCRFPVSGHRFNHNTAVISAQACLPDLV